MARRWIIGLLMAQLAAFTACRCGPRPSSAPADPTATAKAKATVKPKAKPPSSPKPAASLSLLTYNVLADPDPADARTTALLAILGQSRADVLALQEVAPWFLTRLMAQPWAKGYKATTFDGRVSAPGGQMVLSRLPITRSMVRLLPGPQRRTVVVAVIDLGGGRRVAVATTHMESYLEDGAVRARQLAQIFALVAPFDAAVVLGDLNFGDGEQPETARLDRRYTDVWLALKPSDPGYTWDIERSVMARRGSFKGERSRRLDRILVRVAGYRPRAARIIGQRPVKPGGEIFPSDHFGLIGTIARR